MKYINNILLLQFYDNESINSIITHLKDDVKIHMSPYVKVLRKVTYYILFILLSQVFLLIKER